MAGAPLGAAAAARKKKRPKLVAKKKVTLTDVGGVDLSKARDASELAKYGFVGASQLSNLRAAADKAVKYSQEPKAQPLTAKQKAEKKLPIPEQQRQAIIRAT